VVAGQTSFWEDKTTAEGFALGDPVDPVVRATALPAMAAGVVARSQSPARRTTESETTARRILAGVFN
jgi:hypothetical protein